MKHYMTYMGQTLAFKNNLERAVADMLTTENRKLIAEQRLGHYQHRILNLVKKLNSQFPRCKPISVYWDQSSLDRAPYPETHRLRGIYFVDFSMYACSAENKKGESDE